MNIAIQGIAGSFHHIGASQFFGDTISITPCLTFDEMPLLLKENKVDYLFMAIENSIAGTILPNYMLLDDFDLKIIGEEYLPIKHQLMALDGVSMDSIKEIWSHPMAINQCRPFLRKYPHIKVLEKEDTAASAQIIAEQKLKGIAAIASTKASEIYQLPILKQDIHSNTDNFTRFFVLSQSANANNANKDYTKVSIKFVTNHRKGSLAAVLNLFLEFDLNLSKIQSLPIADKPWSYAFFADLLLEEKHSIDTLLNALRQIVEEVKVFGMYNNKNLNI